MTRFVVDAGVVLHLLAEGIEISKEHRLVAPTLVRSQVLTALYGAVRGGEISEDLGRDRLARLSTMKMRLLGDKVLQRRAWSVAEELGWDSTYTAEYIALTQLQADAFVTTDAELARSVRGVVDTAPLDALL